MPSVCPRSTCMSPRRTAACSLLLLIPLGLTIVARAMRAQTPATLPTVVQIAADWHVLALMSDGTVSALGNNRSRTAGAPRNSWFPARRSRGASPQGRSGRRGRRRVVCRDSPMDPSGHGGAASRAISAARLKARNGTHQWQCPASGMSRVLPSTAKP